MCRISEIRTGGQSGVDRGAFDAARDLGVPISGWCPIGGWAEDYPEPPGLLVDYPEMVECDSVEPIRRTELNIRDSSACIVLDASGDSPGTDAGMTFFETYNVPYLELDIYSMFDADGFGEALDSAIQWLEQFDDNDFVLGVGGPRESEVEGGSGISYNLIHEIIEYFRYA